jgi:hypothetical protein
VDGLAPLGPPPIGQPSAGDGPPFAPHQAASVTPTPSPTVDSAPVWLQEEAES